MAMTKGDLLGRMGKVRLNYLLGTSLLEMVDEPMWVRISKGMHWFKGSLPLLIDLHQEMAEVIADPKTREGYKHSFEASLRRSLLRELFELVDWYCGSSKQKSAFQNWAHFRFYRAIRLSIAHGEALGTLVKDRSELKNEEWITWRDITLSRTTVEPPVSDQHAMYYYEDLAKFVEGSLS
jgi:hypothetical protein